VNPARRSIGASFDRFLFAPADALSAAIFRIILATTLTANFWRVGEIIPTIARSAWMAPLYRSVFLTAPYHALCLWLIVLFAAGVRPCALGLLLVAMLAPLDFVSIGQQSRQILLFELLAFSFLRSDGRLAPRIGSTDDAAKPSGPMWPIRLIQIQLSIVYGVNALVKTTPAYLRGDVLIGLSRMLPNFRANLSDGYLHLGAIAIPVMLAACLSVAIEYVLAVGFWFPRLRWPTTALGVAYHLILMSILRIYLLDWTSIAMYPAFLLPFERTPRGHI
jgi:hypothetical protein